MPPISPHQPTLPYSEGYYEARMHSKHRYEPTQGYEEIKYPIEKAYPIHEEYIGYSCNQPMEKVTKEDDDLYKRLK